MRVRAGDGATRTRSRGGSQTGPQACGDLSVVVFLCGLSRGPRVGAAGARTRCITSMGGFSWTNPRWLCPRAAHAREDSTTSRQTSCPTQAAGPRIQRGAGFFKRTILRSQRSLLTSNSRSISSLTWALQAKSHACSSLRKLFGMVQRY